MIGWWKCSSGRASDVLWQGLSFAARGLLATLEDAADGSGSVPMPDGTEALARVVGGWQGADQVLLLLAELERAGRVVVDHEGHQLLLPHAVREDELRKPAPRARAVAADDGAEEHTGRRKVTRAHKLYFARRERCWRDVPAGVTFDAWLASPEGVLWLDGGTADGTPESVPRNGGGTFRGTGRNGGGTPLPSHTLPSQKEQRDRENASDAGAHEPGDTPDAERTDPSRNGGGTFRGTHTERNAERSATVPPPRCATVEMTTAREVTAGAALMALRGAQLRLTITTPQEAELGRVLGDVEARGQGWTRMGVERLTEHLRAQHVATGRDGRPWTPTTSSLRGADGSWARLLALYDEADGCPRCAEERDARRARTEAPKLPPTPALRVLTNEERMAETRRARVEIEAQRAARATTPTTTTEAHHGG